MKVKSSENASFGKVYTEVFPVLMRVAYHVTYSIDVSEDIVQEAFIRFYEKNMEFPSVDEAKYWLIRVTKNLAINVVKRKSREKAMVDKIKKVPKPQFKMVKIFSLMQRLKKWFELLWRSCLRSLKVY